MAEWRLDVPGGIRSVQRELGVQGWPQFEFELLRAYVLQCAFLSTPGSHKEKQETWHSAKSDTQAEFSVQYVTTF